MAINNNFSLDNSKQVYTGSSVKITSSPSILSENKKTRSELSDILVNLSDKLAENLNINDPVKLPESFFKSYNDIDSIINDIAKIDGQLTTNLEKLSSLKEFVRKSKDGKYDQLDSEYRDKIIKKIEKLIEEFDVIQKKLRDLEKSNKLADSEANLKVAKFLQIAKLRIVEVDNELKKFYEEKLESDKK